MLAAACGANSNVIWSVLDEVGARPVVRAGCDTDNYFRGECTACKQPQVSGLSNAWCSPHNGKNKMHACIRVLALSSVFWSTHAHHTDHLGCQRPSILGLQSRLLT